MYLTTQLTVDQHTSSGLAEEDERGGVGEGRGFICMSNLFIANSEAQLGGQTVIATGIEREHCLSD